MGRSLALLLLGAFAVAACDTTADDGDGASVLAAFSPTTAAVVRAEVDAAGSDSLTLEPPFDALPVDPRALDEVYYAADPDPAAPLPEVPDQAVLVGRFDAATLADALGGGTAYRGAIVLRAQGYEGPTLALAVTDRALLVAPTEAGVRAMLDRRSGAAPSLADDATAVRLMGRLAGRLTGVLLPTGAGLADLLGGGTPFPVALPTRAAAVALDFSFSEEDELAFDGTAWLAPNEGTSAAALAPVLRASTAAALTAPGLDERTRAVLASLDFRADGPDVRMTFTLPFSFGGAFARSAPAAPALAR